MMRESSFIVSQELVETGLTPVGWSLCESYHVMVFVTRKKAERLISKSMPVCFFSWPLVLYPHSNFRILEQKLVFYEASDRCKYHSERDYVFYVLIYE